MKKLFSYLLISSMVVLSSCTNYDDQFDDLNTQINTLKSQIEGFSSLSSGLTALQGTVASLQTAIANIPVTPATDISGLESTQATLTAALTALAADVKALQDTLATAATAAEVAALQTALAAAQSDLTDLLAANNVYSQDLIIDSASTLAFAESLGDKVGIINGSVVMYVTTTMDVAKVQAIANKIKTITGNLSYYAAANTIAAVSFDALTGAGDIEIAQAGSISFPVLASAKAITLGNNYESKFDGVVDLGALETVTSIGTQAITYHSSGASTAALVTVGSVAANANSIKFSKATGVDLASLTRYDANFVVAVKSGTLDLSALTNANATAGAADTTYSLTASGVTVLTAPLRTGGTITAGDVVDVSLPVWTGTSGSTFAKAKTVVLPKITGTVDIDLSKMAPKATKFHYIGAAKATSSTVSVYPSFTTGGANSYLETLIVDGVSTSVNVSDATELTSLTLTGNANVVTINDADSMTALTLGHTSKVKTFNYGTLEISDNDELVTVTAASLDDISSLTITGNTELTTITMASLNSLGKTSTGTALAAASVNISGNNLTASNIQLASETGAVTAVAGKITTNSGLTDLETYILAAAALDTAPNVTIDHVTAVTNVDGTAATSVSTVATGANKGFSWAGEDSPVRILQKVAAGSSTAAVTARNQTATAKLDGTIMTSATSGSTVDGKILSINPNGTVLATVEFDANGIKGKSAISGFVATNPSTYASALETELNAQMDAASAPFDVDIVNDYDAAHKYTVQATASGVTGATLAAKPFKFSIGGVALTGTDGTDILGSIDTAIAAAGSPLSQTWDATVASGVLTLKKFLSKTTTVDVFSTEARPILAFSGYEAALSTTHALVTSANAISTATAATSKGWRVTVKNESLTVKAANLEDTKTFAGGTIGTSANVTNASIGGALSNTSVVVNWADIRAGVSASAAVTTTFVSWL